MATKRDYVLLAKMKVKAKELETKMEVLQKKILANNPESKVETEFGYLCLSKRENFSIPDNAKIIDNIISREDFDKNAKIAPGKLKEVIGTTTFDQCIKEGLVVKSESSEFYTLRKTCK